MSYLVAEEIDGLIGYHLSRESFPEKSLCGRTVVPTTISPSDYGATFGVGYFKHHIWCSECAKLAGLEVPYPGEEF